ncbi:nuclear transport factor 2 family protein [Acerihabitans sp. TG2]|uniref:nuclear transport factor 2 family protein n=1 Tax=Acerihabitans sp. TG2 TaxID=3096008 RepID=UPI002B239F9E|nr:nuclear transport factor 2 family protein [Acerihabitans sp. TG2]MEA9392555.1 nuclear transport factor 2 family protein [Acerihabitans sp. TG2]
MSKPVPDPHQPAEVLTRLYDFYRQLGLSQLPQLSLIYHPQVVFIDPVSQYDGVDALEHYFTQLLKKVKYCRFDVQPALVQGDDASLFWRMEYAHPALKKGQGITVMGASHLRLAENRVIYQRDYYDLGAMLYEHVPVLGGAVRALKARLK